MTALRLPRGVGRASVAGPWTRHATALTLLAAALLLLGLVASFSASVATAAQEGDAFGVFRRQLTWAVLGLIAFTVVVRLDHRVWRTASWVLLPAALVGLAAVLVPGVGLSQGGATRWLAVGPLVVQPSELAKLALVVWLADVTARKRERRGGDELPLDHLLVPAVPVFALMSLLVMLEPDLGTTLLLALIVGLLLWVEGIPVRMVLAGGALGGALTWWAVTAASYRMRRIDGWLSPESDPLGAGFQLLQSLYALGEGGWTGVGLGSSRQKWNFVPNPETDFVFAIIGEELGLLGALLTLALFAGLLVTGLAVARSATDHFGRIVAFVITGWIVGQALVNVCTVTGLLPITGVTLPLVSAGGSSLVSTLVAVGILVAIARSTSGADVVRAERRPVRAGRGPA